MKKWKVIFISIAVVMGIGGAFASNIENGSLCGYYNQFRFTGGTWVDLGEEGVDYACINNIGVCTYYKPSPSSPYLPCHTGQYYPLYPIDKKK